MHKIEIHQETLSVLKIDDKALGEQVFVPADRKHPLGRAHYSGDHWSDECQTCHYLICHSEQKIRSKGLDPAVHAKAHGENCT